MKLGPEMSNWLLSRLATMFGIVPSTLGASRPGPTCSRARSIHPGGPAHSLDRVASRQRTPKRDASGSTPIPT